MVAVPRVRAPELRGRGGWINTGGRTLSLGDLRGKVVLLDFWTFCCINCLHVLDELRALEKDLHDVLVVVGVHSPKFVHEAEHEAVVDAVARYEVEHPVLDDPDLATWRAYAVRAWPTLVVIDPEGYVVGMASGEGHGAALGALIREVVRDHEERGTLRRGANPYVAPEQPESQLRFPAKAVPFGDQLLLADTGHHRIVTLDALTATVRVLAGNGRRGSVDGRAEDAAFAEPQGICVLPDDVAQACGYHVLVADTANHVLRGIDTATGDVVTVAGTGHQLRRPPSPGSQAVALDIDLSSPWDVAWWDVAGERGAVVVAMAGTHQLWWFDPVAGRTGVLAGTAGEGLVDGPAADAWLAQPSGLAASPDGRLWFVDAETSSLRQLRDGAVTTAVGDGLFDFGHVDGAGGPEGPARLQHPLGLAVVEDGSVLVADTYNDAVRRFDPATGELTTVSTGLHEPADVVVCGEHAWVVESAGHAVRTLDVTRGGFIDGGSHRTQRPLTDVPPGAMELRVIFEPPPGQHLDERDGPATRLRLESTPPDLLSSGAGIEPGLHRPIELTAGVEGGVLHVTAWAAACDDGEDAEHAACHLTMQDWGIPVRVVEGADPRLVLVLHGMDAGVVPPAS